MEKIISEIESLAKEFSMDQVGFAELARPLTIDFYNSWLEAGHHGTMKYLEDHAPLKESPQKFWPLATSAIVFTKAYYPHPKTDRPPALKAARTALYARGEDYHHWFKAELQAMATRLQLAFPEAQFVALTDSSPVLERDLAQRAGLGWFGKNTCLIHPKKGSLFFIGEIYTSLLPAKDLPLSTQSLPDFCGTCSRCIEICPTQALEKPKSLNATKCISYLTIESKEVPPIDLREKIGDWLFGCDLCQTICPWNEKLFKGQFSTEKQLSQNETHRQILIDELRDLLSLSGKKLQKKFIGSPLLRAGPFGLRRNAIVVAANQKLIELKPEIQAFLQDERLGELAQWCLTSFG